MRRHEAGLALAAVAELPTAQRDAVLMAYGRGLSTAEIAKAAGVPLGTAKSRLRQGLQRTRQALLDHGLRGVDLNGRGRGLIAIGCG